MLFASLESEHEGTLIAVIFGHTHDTSGHLSDKFLRATHVAHVRTTEEHRYSQALAIADSDISPPLAWCLQHCKVGGNRVDDEESLVLMTRISKTGEVLNDTKDIWLLNHHTGNTFKIGG